MEIRNTPDIKNNEIFSFYYDKYYSDDIDKEAFYLSGIQYVYKCLDAVVDDAGMNNLCVIENGLCSECCNRQEAHVSMAEMRLFVEANVDSWYNYIDIALQHAKHSPNDCSDMFFIDGKCSIYQNRFFICRAYMNLFNGEPYCPRHNKTDILVGPVITEIVDCFYYFIDQLSSLNKKYYYGSITPTYFFVLEYIKNSVGSINEITEFFKDNSLDVNWIKTYKPIEYSIGTLGSVRYNKKYIEMVKETSEKLSNYK